MNPRFEKQRGDYVPGIMAAIKKVAVAETVHTTGNLLSSTAKGLTNKDREALQAYVGPEQRVSGLELRKKALGNLRMKYDEAEERGVALFFVNESGLVKATMNGRSHLVDALALPLIQPGKAYPAYTNKWGYVVPLYDEPVEMTPEELVEYAQENGVPNGILNSALAGDPLQTLQEGERITLGGY